MDLGPPQTDMAMVSIPVIRHWLFAPDRTRTKSRRFTVDIKHHGKRVAQEFVIGDIHAAIGKGYGILTTRHQKALMVLQEIWQRQGGRMTSVGNIKQGYVSSSSWELGEKLFNGHGGKQVRLVRQVIQELSSIPVSIKNYIGGDGEIFDIDMTGLISGALFSNSRHHSHPTNPIKDPWVEIALGSIVTRAFEQRAIKPINMAVMKSLNGDISSLLYPKLDYLLHSNSSVSFSLGTLVKNLGLRGEVQKRPSRRRRLFDSAAKSLTGKALSGRNRILRASISPGVGRDGEDFFIAEAVRVP